MENNPFESSIERGIKGWLILVAIGVVISPIRIIGGFVLTFLPLFTSGGWRMLVTPGSDAYSPLWVPILAFETTYNVAMSLLSMLMVILFFTHHRFFPRVYILIMLASVIMIPLDAWFVSLALPDVEVFDETTTREFSRLLVASAIWIPYMLKSKRVKVTFVRGRETAEKAVVQ